MNKTFPPIHAGTALSKVAINRVINGFINKDLPKAEWTHEAHFITALHFIRTHGLDYAETQMPGMISAYNIAAGGLNTDTDGYHHTLTIFYLRILARYNNQNAQIPFVKLCENILISPQGARDYPLTYYSKELLFSVKARKNWIKPDLQNM